MKLLCIDLELSKVWNEELSSPAVSYALSYLKKDPDALFIAAPAPDGISISGYAEVSFIYTSPITGKASLSHSNLMLGMSLIRMGFAGIMIVGSSIRLSYITVDKENTEILPGETLRGRSSADFEQICSRNSLDQCISVGRAGDNGVVFASIQYRGRNIRGEGLGNIFFKKGLKGLVIAGYDYKEEKTAASSLYGKTRSFIEHSRFSRRIRKEGSCTIIDDALRLGWIPVRNCSSRFDPRAYGLDGRSICDEFGVHPSTCIDCFFSCGRRTQDNRLLPYWRDMIALGSNLGFFSIFNVIRLFDAAMEEGLDTKYLGSILAYVMSLSDDDIHWLGLKDRTPEELESLIHRIGSAKDAGLRYKNGLASFPEAYQSGYHQAIGYDLRGAYGNALLLMLGLDLELPSLLFLAPVDTEAECSAVFALYEAVYSLALISLGFSPMAAAVYTERIPFIAYKIPAAARFFWRHYKAFGLSGRELFGIGLPIFNELIGDRRELPVHFLSDAESAKGGRVVPAARLYECFRFEKLSAEIWEKSRREKRIRPSSFSRTAVGPSDERGLDGEPGLTK